MRKKVKTIVRHIDDRSPILLMKWEEVVEVAEVVNNYMAGKDYSHDDKKENIKLAIGEFIEREDDFISEKREWYNEGFSMNSLEHNTITSVVKVGDAIELSETEVRAKNRNDSELYHALAQKYLSKPIRVINFYGKRCFLYSAKDYDREYRLWWNTLLKDYDRYRVQPPADYLKDRSKYLSKLRSEFKKIDQTTDAGRTAAAKLKIQWDTLLFNL